MAIKKLSEIKGECLIESTGITESLRINLIADSNSGCYRVTFDDERTGVQHLYADTDSTNALQKYGDFVKEYFSKVK